MKPKLPPIKVGSQVAMNRLPDAVWFEVLEINGFALTVREALTDHKAQWIDICQVMQVK